MNLSKRYFNVTKATCTTWLIAAGLVGCSHLPVKEIPITANPTEEIDKVEAERTAAAEQQVNVLSPTYFDEATDQLKKAKESRDRGSDTKVILDRVALARANLEKANEIAQVSRTTLSGVVQARTDAIAAGAPNLLGKEFKETDVELAGVASQIESNDLSSARKLQDRLTERYKDLEIRAIKIDKLAGATNIIKQAVSEGAKENAPRSLEAAETVLADADSFISANPHDKAGIQARADATNEKANQLLNVSRQAKVTDKNDSESIVLERQALNKRLAEEKLAAEKKRAELAAANEQTQSLANENRTLTNQTLDAKRLAAAKARFDSSEADVYQDGNRLVVRLKKVAFPSGKANLTPASLPLLGKAQQVIADLGPSKVTIEGHTDAVGSKSANQKLSETRAAAISSYLSSNGVAAAEIDTVGLGDTKPIASNKTAEGRAQNRRVDIIIEPTVAAH